ncbi:MAG: hypothetical protein ACYC63_13025 [Armatimonadota bacterium]
MTEQVLYIGWDVGGWEGKHDGLCVLRADEHGQLAPCQPPVCIGLRGLLCDRAFCIRSLLGACGVSDDWGRVVLGIDAPLGWPLEAARLIQPEGNGQAPYVPGCGGEIENRLAYRFCDRVVYRRCGAKKPLTAVFDRLGNNATKAITACRLLARSDGAVLVPQQGTVGQVVICEAYPALWKTGGRKTDPIREEAKKALVGCELPEPGCDEADAVLCALTAACYDNQSRSLGMDLPELYLPEDEYERSGVEANGPELAREEGWIYFPKAVVR